MSTGVKFHIGWSIYEIFYLWKLTFLISSTKILSEEELESRNLGVAGYCGVLGSRICENQWKQHELVFMNIKVLSFDKHGPQGTLNFGIFDIREFSEYMAFKRRSCIFKNVYSINV